MKKYILICILGLLIVSTGCTEEMVIDNYKKIITVDTISRVPNGNCNCIIMGTDDTMYKLWSVDDCSIIKLDKTYLMSIVTNKECDVINIENTTITEEQRLKMADLKRY